MIGRRLYHRGLVLVGAVALRSVAQAQGTITIAAGTSASTVVAPLSKFAVPIVIDMTAAGGTNLAALSTGVTWARDRLTFDSLTAGAFGPLTVNTALTGAGRIDLSASSASGATGVVSLANLWFTAASSLGGTAVAVAPTAAANPLGASIIAQLRARDLDVCIAQVGKWGDVTGDNNVDVLDAQQVARYTVGLPVRSLALVVAQGDVTNDGLVNIIDSQQLARYSVGLSAAARTGTNAAFIPPPVSSVTVDPAGAILGVGEQVQLSATAAGAGGVALTGCAPTVAWVSSNNAIATVSADGLVTAVAAGTATITASAGGQSSAAVIQIAAAQGDFNSWTNGSGNQLWSNPSNWSLGHVPLGLESVSLSLGGDYTIVLDGDVSVASITVGGGGTVSIHGTITAGSVPVLNLGGPLTVLADGKLGLDVITVNGGSIENSGTLTTRAAVVFADIHNQGTLVTHSNANFHGAFTTTAASTIRLESGDPWAGTFAEWESGFTNNGKIEFTSANSYAGWLSVASGTLVNAPGATIAVPAGSSNPHQLTASLDNQGTLTVGSPLSLGPSAYGNPGGLTNSGTIALTTGDLTLIPAGPGHPFSNAGTITVGAGRTLNVRGVASFTQQPGATLNGGGALSLELAQSRATTAVLNTDFTLSAVSVLGSTATFTTPLSNASVTWTISSATINAPSFTNAALHTQVIASSALNAAVVNDGTLIVEGAGTPTGLVNVKSLTTAGALSIDVGGRTPGSQHDKLVVEQAAALGGTLNVSLINGFAPVAGDTFTVMTFASHTGAFATLNLPALPAGVWQVRITNTAVLLVVDPLPTPPTVATPAAAGSTPVGGTTAALSVLGADAGGAGSLTYAWTTTGVPPAPVSFSPNGTNTATASTATFTKAGTYSLQVTISNAAGLSTTSTVVVTVAQTLTAITVSPPSATVPADGTQSYAATAFDQFAQPLSVAPTFSWSVTGGGAISTAGVFTAGDAGGGPFSVTASSGAVNGTAAVTVLPPTGLDFPGADGSGSIRFAFANPVSYPATIIMRVFPRVQPRGTDMPPYYTAFFYGNDGAFQANNDFYGFHPYPDWTLPNTGATRWEIAAPPGTDNLGPSVVYNTWYQQAAVVSKTPDGEVSNHMFYWDFADAAHVFSYEGPGPLDPPTTPVLVFGDAPWNAGLEEWSGVMRGFQIYDAVLTREEIAQEIARPGSSAQGSHLWYLNLNPTPTDISDKSGHGHNPAWVGAGRATLWTGTP